MLRKLLSLDNGVACPLCGAVVSVSRGECPCGAILHLRFSGLGWGAVSLAALLALVAAHTSSHLFHDGAMDPFDMAVVVLCWLAILLLGAVAWKTKRVDWERP